MVNTWKQHLSLLAELFGRLSNAGLTVKPSNCVIGAESSEVIGHKILADGIKGLLQDNVEKIRNAWRPKTKKEVKAFLGLTGHYREFIPNYANKAVPLSDLLRKGQANKIDWEETQERPYATLKSKLTNSPILRLPDVAKQFFLRTDASDVGVGAVLLKDHAESFVPLVMRVES